MSKVPLYHIVLRTSALTLAIVLVFESGLLSPVTHELALHTEHYLAQAIGMSASVTPTTLNETTAYITQKEQQLNQREAALNQRELALGMNASSTPGATSNTTFYLSVVLFILLVLIVWNYVLDYLRVLDAKAKALTQQHEKVG